MKTTPKRNKAFLSLPPMTIKTLRHLATEMGLVLGPGLNAAIEAELSKVCEAQITRAWLKDRWLATQSEKVVSTPSATTSDHTK